jgi:adenylate cyclase
VPIGPSAGQRPYTQTCCPARTVDPVAERPSEDQFRAVLTGESAELARMRGLLRRLPSPPHCKLCAAPFAGPGGVVLRRFGFARSAVNPQLCNNCLTGFVKRGITGAEIPVTLVFADIRGSTTIGESMRPADFRAYLDRFYRLGSRAILEHDGLVDKLVGDEIIGLFFGGITGQHHAAAAVAAARALLRAATRPDASPSGPIPVGAAVHTGIAYVGTTGPEGAVTDFTALGDAVNTTARVAAAAVTGELLVTTDAAAAAELDRSNLAERRLSLRGRTDPIAVVSLNA